MYARACTSFMAALYHTHTHTLSTMHTRELWQLMSSVMSQTLSLWQVHPIYPEFKYSSATSQQNLYWSYRRQEETNKNIREVRMPVRPEGNKHKSPCQGRQKCIHQFGAATVGSGLKGQPSVQKVGETFKCVGEQHPPPLHHIPMLKSSLKHLKCSSGSAACLINQTCIDHPIIKIMQIDS